MTLPSNETCIRVIELLDGDPALTPWELKFVKSNVGRTEFSTSQKEVIYNLTEKYECE